MRGLGWALGAVIVVATAACGGKDGSCVRSGDAKVCADGGKLSAEGLEPGSTLKVTVKGDTSSFEVGRSGKPNGTVGVLSLFGTSGEKVRVAATAADGRSMRGTLDL